MRNYGTSSTRGAAGGSQSSPLTSVDDPYGDSSIYFVQSKRPPLGERWRRCVVCSVPILIGVGLLSLAVVLSIAYFRHVHTSLPSFFSLTKLSSQPNAGIPKYLPYNACGAFQKCIAAGLTTGYCCPTQANVTLSCCL